MSDEEKVTVEEEKPEFDDSREPIESIEKTVEELKRKIQELSETAAEKEKEEDPSIPDFIAPAAEKAEEVKETLSESVENIKEKTAETVKNNPDLAKTLDFIRANVIKAADATRDAFTKIASDPKVQEVGEKTQEAVKNAGDAISEAAKPIVQNIDEFMNKPEVQEKIADIRTAAADTIDRAKEAVENILHQGEEAPKEDADSKDETKDNE